MDSIPLVVLSGQVPTTVIGEDAFQETDMVGCSRPIVKHSFLVKRPEDIPDAIAKAYYIAKTGRPGPVVVDLPKDIVNPQIKAPYHFPKEVNIRSYKPSTKGHPKQIKKAVECLVSAKRPVIYTGGGVIASNACNELVKLAEMLKMPVTNTLMGLGTIPGTHPQFIGMLGMHGTYEANKAMQNADVIFAVGARFDDRVTNNVKKFCPNATIVHVDVDPTSISKTIQAHVPVVGEAKDVLNQIIEHMSKKALLMDSQAIEQWWTQIEQWREVDCLAFQTTPDVIQPQQVIESLYDVTNGDAYIASDVGQHQMFAALYYPFKKPRQWINSGGLGTMGFGFPAAMGVKLAFKDADVACVTGDGSIQMNIQELATCLQYDIPVKIININNSSLGMVKQWQSMFYDGRHSHSYMDSLPDFVKLVEAYHHVGIKVTKPEELKPALEKAFSLKDKLVFVDIDVDPLIHVYPMQIKGGKIDDMVLAPTDKEND
jgi:acetolactate synthase-1/2/3 large subunit